MKGIFSPESIANIPENNTYLRSYSSMLSFFANKDKIFFDDVVVGAHMVYGWMPTILELHIENKADLEYLASLLMKAKEEKCLSSDEIACVANSLNHSVIGASKLLHFVQPETFPIWDSKIYTFLYEKKPHHYQVNKVELYLQFIETLKELSKTSEFHLSYPKICEKLGYSVTHFRAIELMMFLNA